MTHITMIAVTVYLHRHQAHRALDLHPIVSHFFRLWLWLSSGQVTKEWVAIHRKHHATVETEDDPHSPQIHGIKKVLGEGWELYRDESFNPETMEDYGHGTPSDWLERNIYHRYDTGGVVVMAIIDLACFGVVGITIWAVQMMWNPVFAAGVINGAGHYWGYRNYESPDASTNIVPWGILIAGEELHNNHHAFASSAKLSSKWWEFDIGWFYITLMSWVGLAKVKKVAPKPVVAPGKLHVDIETVKAVVTNRFHVMSDYARNVLARVHRDEVRKADSGAKALLGPVRSLLIRDDSLITEEGKSNLKRALESNATLGVVYDFKVRLHEIWEEKTATHESLLASLQEWCRQAEETGIKALQDFAQLIRGYTLQPA